ncbi:MAG: long-chain-fatty-acid--CoA ligase [Gammaproteobacteria bacterium]|nr:long-chain-fatty-acid--CoA ligase [Gammaproteobacteria bacterium]
MHGLMMDTQLLVSSLLRFADANYPNREIVSVTVDNPQQRYTFREAFIRTRKLANALQKLGLESGDRVGTLAWNDHRHLELYYAISGSGFVCHTINPRLYPEQVTYIVNHAEDRFLFVDPLVMPVVEALAAQFKAVEGIVVMTDEAHMPETNLPNVMCYETLIADESDEFEWPEFDERTASTLCYTSGTTGHPKGVLYTHRSIVLHAYAGCLPDVLAFSGHDCVLMVVPMFHVNGWGIPYSAIMVGAKIVMPGPKMADGEVLHALMEKEEVSVASGVPTIWLALLDYLDTSGNTLSSVNRVSVGGAACPRSIIEDFDQKYGISVHQGWGMTETSPLGTVYKIKPGMGEMSKEERYDLQAKQGCGVFGIEMRITDEDNQPLPWDGVAFGTLKVRGPWVASSYYRLDDADSPLDENGWFDTGDVSTIDPNGVMQITDRTKDVIKSGGEWISSIDLENAAVDHPDVAEAAVIGRNHPKWTERPLLIVVVREGQSVSKEQMLAWFDGRVATWWKPNDVVFVDELPHTATGKINKLGLREQFADYQFPDA